MREIALALVAISAVAVFSIESTPTSAHEDEGTAPIFGIRIPPGYRDWRVISVGHEEGDLNDLRVQLGNDSAIRAYREGRLPFPDGAIIAAVHWEYSASEENNRVFGQRQSFVAGTRKNIQFMIKDSKKYAASGGWGFADFNDGKASDEAKHRTCFPCHQLAKEHDYVFTRYAP